MPLVPFDFMPFGALVDPYPDYARMRDAGRVLQSPMGVVLVHRYEDVRRTHADHESFSMGAMGGMMGGMVGGDPDDGPFMADTMLTADPPDHGRLRGVVNRAFTPRSINALEGRIREITREMLAPIAKGEPFDVVADFAAPLPTIVIAELLGVPPEDADQFRLWSEAITGTDVRQRILPDEAVRYRKEMQAYLDEQIARARVEPGDNLIGRMVTANADGAMSDSEVAGSCVLLLLAGNETTMRLISNMSLALGRHPEQQQRLLDDRSMIPSAVEETLRYDSPVQFMFRATKQPVSIGDAELTPGTFVLTMIAAANRDPEAFDDPDTYDVGRKDNLHVSFGHGIHFCLGAPLARLETRVAFEELFDLIPGGFRVLTNDDELVYPPMAMLRSPSSLVLQAN